jgi:hypothetical protein
VWAVAAAAIGLQLAAFIEHASGAELPRDIEHLRRQNEVIRRAHPGAWAAASEMPLTIDQSGRVVDVLLQRAARREAVVVEVWDYLADVGAALRGLDEKVTAVPRSLPEWRVQGLWVVRGTRRNVDLMRSLAKLVRARFPANPDSWLAALDALEAPMPLEPGLLWTQARSPALCRRPRSPARCRRPRPRGSQANETAR